MLKFFFINKEYTRQVKYKYEKSELEKKMKLIIKVNTYFD